MSRIRGKNTKPEIIVRQLLWRKGYRYRLHQKELPGTPDIVFPSRKKCIFVHGCFWHKHSCTNFKWPATNKKFWHEKITNNAIRDENNFNILRNAGWEHLVIWECEIKNTNQMELLDKLDKFIDRNS